MKKTKHLRSPLFRYENDTDIVYVDAWTIGDARQLLESMGFPNARPVLVKRFAGKDKNLLGSKMKDI